MSFNPHNPNPNRGPGRTGSLHRPRGVSSPAHSSPHPSQHSETSPSVGAGSLPEPEPESGDRSGLANRSASGSVSGSAIETGPEPSSVPSNVFINAFSGDRAAQRTRSSTIMGPFPVTPAAQFSHGQASDGDYESSGIAGSVSGVGAGGAQISIPHGQGFLSPGSSAAATVGPVYFHQNQLPLQAQQYSSIPSRGHGGRGGPSYHSRQASHGRDMTTQRSRQHAASHSHPHAPFTQHHGHNQNQNPQQAQMQLPPQQPLQHQSQPYSAYLPQDGMLASYPPPVQGQSHGHGQGQTHTHPHHQPQRRPPPQTFPTEINDIYALLHCVNSSPDLVVLHIQGLRAERDRLRDELERVQRKNTEVTQNFDNLRRDYASAKRIHEQLNQVWMEKQLLFWKFVERIRRGEGEGFVRHEEGVGGGGEWIGGDENEEGGNATSVEDVEEMWGREPARGDGIMRAMADMFGRELSPSIASRPDDATMKSEQEEFPQRGRSSTLLLRSFAPRTETMDKREGEREGSSLPEESILSGSESVADSNILRLDPSARPFIPSPTRSTRTPSQHRTIASSSPPESNTPKALPAVPLTFRDIILRPPPPPGSPTPTPTPRQTPTAPSMSASAEVKKQESRAIQASKRADGSSRDTSRESARVGKRGGKYRGTDRGDQGGYKSSPSRPSKKADTSQGSQLQTMASLLFGSSSSSNPTSKKQDLSHYPTIAGSWKESAQKGTSRSPSRIPPAAQQHLTSGSQESSPTKKRKVSPDLARVANLPAYPASGPIPTSSYTGANQTSLFDAKVTIKMAKGSQTQGKHQIHPAPTFLSRSRMNATLSQISAPYNTICPFSLLQAGECDVKGCSLLHLCPKFNNAPTAPPEFRVEEKDPEVEFPPLGSPPPRKMSKSFAAVSIASVLTPCEGVGMIVKEGEICAAGKIHILRSCLSEIGGEDCSFWSSAMVSSPEKPKASSPQKLSENSPEKSSEENSSEGRAEAEEGEQFTSAAVEIKIHIPDTVSGSGGESGKEREMHFAKYIHERDGVGREAWQARVLNASLRETHRCGLWGVDVRFGVSYDAEFEDRNIEWKGSRGGVGGSADAWKKTTISKGKEKSKDTFGPDEESVTRGAKWEEKKVLTREDWVKRGGWGGK